MIPEENRQEVKDFVLAHGLYDDLVLHCAIFERMGFDVLTECRFSVSWVAGAVAHVELIPIAAMSLPTTGLPIPAMECIGR